MEFSPENTNEHPKKRLGRRKIKIEYIQDKTKRGITFCKRRKGLMKKARELCALTGAQVLLLISSEKGSVYTFSSPKFDPIVATPEGKETIQSCINAPDPIKTNDNLCHQDVLLERMRSPELPSDTTPFCYYYSDP